MQKKKNSSDNNERERFIFEGTIVDPIKDIMFHVRLDKTDEIVLGYLSGNIRRNRIRVLLGDRVKIIINEFDSKKGKIFYRFPPRSKKTRLEKSKNDHQAMENTSSTESLLNKETKNPISGDSPQSTDQRNNKDTTPNQD
uniref:translation initiation factor 1 n=1 Tax=Carex littledalei TaxID=544730 RepID=UPI0021CCBCBA|nr:translation initiation factor 1 [Carex littledalei]UWT58552.1 translation initiation factor 1 [Carex littledalei]